MRYLLVLALAACSTTTRAPSSVTYHCAYKLNGEASGELQFSRSFTGSPEVSWNEGKSWETMERTPSPSEDQQGLVSWHAGTITDRAFFAVQIPGNAFQKERFEGRTLYSTEEKFDPMSGEAFPSGERGGGTIRCSR